MSLPGPSVTSTLGEASLPGAHGNDCRYPGEDADCPDDEAVLPHPGHRLHPHVLEWVTHCTVPAIIQNMSNANINKPTKEQKK